MRIRSVSTSVSSSASVAAAMIQKYMADQIQTLLAPHLNHLSLVPNRKFPLAGDLYSDDAVH